MWSNSDSFTTLVIVLVQVGQSTTWGPFHKSLNACVKMLAGLRSTLGVKSNPAKRKMNVSFSFTKEIHAGVEARQHGFD